MKTKIPCHCGSSFDYIYEENVEIDRQIADDIIDGKFMNAQCSKCGITLKPDLPITLIYLKKNMKIFLVPELQRDAFLRGKSLYNAKTPDRFVIGYLELGEKLRIFESKLDDVAVECVKFYILSKIEDENKPEAEVTVIFNRITKNDKLEFLIIGLKEDTIGTLLIGRDYYNMAVEKAEAAITTSEEPFCNFLAPPYVSLLRVYRSYEEKEQTPQ